MLSQLISVSSTFKNCAAVPDIGEYVNHYPSIRLSVVLALFYRGTALLQRLTAQEMMMFMTAS